MRPFLKLPRLKLLRGLPLREFFWQPSEAYLVGATPLGDIKIYRITGIKPKRVGSRVGGEDGWSVWGGRGGGNWRQRYLNDNKKRENKQKDLKDQMGTLDGNANIVPPSVQC